MRKFIYVLLLIACQSCNGKKDIESKLIGEWLSYRTEYLVLGEFMVEQSDISDSSYFRKQRYEFNRGGSGRELSLAPEVFSFDYKVKDSVLLFWDRKYKIQRITVDTLVLVELDQDEYNRNDNPENTNRGRVFLKRIR